MDLSYLPGLDDFVQDELAFSDTSVTFCRATCIVVH